MTALQQCLEWARTGFRGVSVHRYVPDGREPIFWVDLWDHSDPVRNAFGYGESQEEAARAALAAASELVFTGKVRSGAVWDEFKRAHHGSVILSLREYGEASRMVDAIQAHRDAMALLRDVEFERTIDFAHEVQGRACRVTPDAFNGSRVVELKTARTSEPVRFARDGRWRGYHAQLSWQQDGIRWAGLGDPDEAYIIAVESARPHPVTVLQLTEAALEEGRRQCRLWLERLLVCEACNRWPGYCESIVPFDVDDSGELTLQIGGEDVEID